MKDFVNAINKLPILVKIILALPVLDGLVYGIYRICNKHLIAGLLWIIFGATIMWVVDIVTIVTTGKPQLFAQ